MNGGDERRGSVACVDGNEVPGPSLFVAALPHHHGLGLRLRLLR